MVAHTRLARRRRGYVSVSREMSQTKELLQLPEDVLRHVLGLLSLNSRLIVSAFAFRCTCRMAYQVWAPLPSSLLSWSRFRLLDYDDATSTLRLHVIYGQMTLWISHECFRGAFDELCRLHINYLPSISRFRCLCAAFRSRLAHLEELSLPNLSLDDMSLRYLKSFDILGARSLRVLALNGNRITPLGLDVLWSPVLKNLESLDLSDNFLGDSVLRWLARAKLQRLHILRLAQNSIGCLGMSYLSRECQQGSFASLRLLDVSQNHVRDVGACMLAVVLARADVLPKCSVLLLNDNPTTIVTTLELSRSLNEPKRFNFSVLGIGTNVYTRAQVMDLARPWNL